MEIILDWPNPFIVVSAAQSLVLAYTIPSAEPEVISKRSLELTRTL